MTPAAALGRQFGLQLCVLLLQSLRRRMSARLDAPTRWDSMWTSPNARITRRLLQQGCVSSAQYPPGMAPDGERGLPLCFERALVSCRCEALDGSGVAPVQRLVQQFARPIAALGEPDAEAVQLVVRRGGDRQPFAARDPTQDLPQLALAETGADDRAVQCRVQLPQPFASRIGLIPKPRQIVQTGQRDRQRPRRRARPEGQLHAIGRQDGVARLARQPGHTAPPVVIYYQYITFAVQPNVAGRAARLHGKS